MRPIIPLFFLAAIAACGGGATEEVEITQAGQLARERAAVHFAEDRFDQARAALQPLVEGAGDPYGQDLLRLAIVELAAENADAARALLARADRKLGDSAALEYNLGRLAIRDGDYEAAVEHFGRAHELAPGDVPSLFQYAGAHATLGNPEAAELFRELLDRGVENTASWHLAALYRLARFQLESLDADASRETMAEFSRLQSTGMATLSPTQLDRGEFGKLRLPQPRDFPGAGDPPLRFEDGPTLAAFAGARGFAVADLEDDWVLPGGDADTEPTIGATQVIGWGEEGILAASRDEDGAWSVRTLWDRPVDLLRWLDYDQDGDLDFWAVRGDEIHLLAQDGGSLAPAAGVELPPLPGAVRDAVVVDQDHEGDLDLLLVGDFGTRLWRDDGAAQGGAFTDVTGESGAAVDAPLRWAVSEDYDTDQDVDFLVGGPETVVILSNLRSTSFEVQTHAFSGAGLGAERPAVRDWTGDGLPDVRFAGGSLWIGQPGGSFARGEESVDAPARLADVDRDGLPDRLALTGAGVEIESGVPGEAGLLPLALRGTSDNRRAIGAIVEYRTGNRYRRVYWRGEPRVLDLGAHGKADWIRITWPNGVVQFAVDVPAGGTVITSQKEGLAGSCPFLYSWNGETYEFVSDVLGITPLGLRVAEGVFVPPDHDEYVLVRGEQLQPRDGHLDLQVTEELREVTYLDRVRLDVLDHPEESEVYPNERFTFPPFPEPHNHSVVDPLTPARATGSDGRDWTAALQARDFDFAVPFEPYQSTRPSDTPWGGQFQGLAPRHHLEIAFPLDRVREAEKLRLLMTGWFFWTNASVNMASSRTPGVGFVPPQLEVPDGEGGWRAIERSPGFPAGKLKTMVVDVTDALVREDPRIRVSSTLCLYWDSIRLATDGDDAPIRVTELEAAEARLWQRGFSRPVPVKDSPEHGLEWFSWDELEPYPRWNQHPGLYTKLGDVLPLLTAIEDRFVVMGAGDALHLRFDADALPPLPEGWTRDYLLFLDGWAKDRDPNCLAVEHVEPMPFHGMSGFPYGEDESFPDTPEHRAWRLEWQTRPARFWVDEFAVH